MPNYSSLTRCQEPWRVFLIHMLTLDRHVSSMCQKYFYRLRNIAPIRGALTSQTAIPSFTSRLDFFNRLPSGLTQHVMPKLQSVQNTAACLITGTINNDHITSTTLNWLPVQFRNQLKIIFLTFQALQQLAPIYKQLDNVRPGPRYSAVTLHVPISSLTSHGDRSSSSSWPIPS